MAERAKTLMCGRLADQSGQSGQFTPSIQGDMMVGPDEAAVDRAMPAMQKTVKRDAAGLEPAHRGTYHLEEQSK